MQSLSTWVRSNFSTFFQLSGDNYMHFQVINEHEKKANVFFSLMRSLIQGVQLETRTTTTNNKMPNPYVSDNQRSKSLCIAFLFTYPSFLWFCLHLHSYVVTLTWRSQSLFFSHFTFHTTSTSFPPPSGLIFSLSTHTVNFNLQLSSLVFIIHDALRERDERMNEHHVSNSVI